MMLKSKIKSKKPIKFGQTIFISFPTNAANPNVDQYKEQMRNQRPAMSEEEINREVTRILERDIYYNFVMDEVAKAYEFDLDEEEIKSKIEALKSPEIATPVDSLRDRASVLLKKALIYEDLASDWEINVSDDYVKSTLERFYRETGNPIREYLMDQEKFEEVRRHLKEEIISNRLLNAFKPAHKVAGDENFVV